MNWVKRYYEENFEELINTSQVLVINGSRQVGKTSLISKMLKDKVNIFIVDGNDMVNCLVMNLKFRLKN